MSSEKRHFEFTHADFPFNDMERGSYTLNRIPTASTGEIYLLALKCAMTDLGYTSLKVTVEKPNGDDNGVASRGGVTFSRTDDKPLQLLHAAHRFEPVFCEDFEDSSIALSLEKPGENQPLDMLHFSSSLDDDKINNHDAAASFFKVAGRFVMRRIEAQRKEVLE